VVSGVEIRSYSGDYADVAELARRVWIPIYAGKTWFPLWDADFFRWQYGAQAAPLSVAAYDGRRLVGSILSMPHELRMGSSTRRIGITSWCTVDPDYRPAGLAMRLIETSRRRHHEQELAFSLGLVSGDRDSLAWRFWNLYAQAQPHNLRFLFRFGVWVKIMAWPTVARASIANWERWTITAGGPVIAAVPFGRDGHVRAYRVEDLDACADMVQQSSGRLDWALHWTTARLARQLDHPVCRTLVFERGDKVRGVINYHHLMFHGHHALRAALIDLWADDALSPGDRVRFLSHACQEMRDSGIEFVVALRSALMPAAAFVANLFLPFPGDGHIVAMYPGVGLVLSRPRTWHLLLR
jgi:GNAT superfamily N-acetyltransferase